MKEEALFVPGQTYRRRVLHERWGGQRQGGISTPSRNNIILLFTGDAGQQHGYFSITAASRGLIMALRISLLWYRTLPCRERPPAPLGFCRAGLGSRRTCGTVVIAVRILSFCDSFSPPGTRARKKRFCKTVPYRLFDRNELDRLNLAEVGPPYSYSRVISMVREEVISTDSC